jgi:hypothetical protein
VHYCSLRAALLPSSSNVALAPAADRLRAFISAADEPAAAAAAAAVPGRSDRRAGPPAAFGDCAGARASLMDRFGIALRRTAG